MKQEEIEKMNPVFAEFMGTTIIIEEKDNTTVPGWKMVTINAKKDKPFSYIKEFFHHLDPKENKDEIIQKGTAIIWKRVAEEAKYHESFDWMIPVYNKCLNKYIQYSGFPEHKNDTACTMALFCLKTALAPSDISHQLDISSTYWKLYDFITWFNKNIRKINVGDPVLTCSNCLIEEGKLPAGQNWCNLCEKYF